MVPAAKPGRRSGRWRIPPWPISCTMSRTASTLPRSPGSFRFVRVGVGVGIVDGVGDVGVVSPNAIVGQL